MHVGGETVPRHARALCVAVIINRAPTTSTHFQPARPQHGGPRCYGGPRWGFWASEIASDSRKLPHPPLAHPPPRRSPRAGRNVRRTGRRARRAPSGRRWRLGRSVGRRIRPAAAGSAAAPAPAAPRTPDAAAPPPPTAGSAAPPPTPAASPRRGIACRRPRRRRALGARRAARGAGAGVRARAGPVVVFGVESADEDHGVVVSRRDAQRLGQPHHLRRRAPASPLEAAGRAARGARGAPGLRRSGGRGRPCRGGRPRGRRRRRRGRRRRGGGCGGARRRRRRTWEWSAPRGSARRCLLGREGVSVQ